MNLNQSRIYKIQNEIGKTIESNDVNCSLGLLTNKIDYGSMILESSFVNAIEMYEFKKIVVYFNQVLNSGILDEKLHDVYGISHINKHYSHNFCRLYNTTDPFVELFEYLKGHDPDIVFVNQLAHFYICENDIYDSWEFKYFLRSLKSDIFSDLTGYKNGSLPFSVVFTASYEYANQGCDLQNDETFSFLAEPYEPLNVIILDEISEKKNRNIQKELSYFTRVVN